MQARPDRRLIPELATVLLVDIPDHGAHHFRIPNPRQVATLFQRVNPANITILMSVAVGEGPGDLFAAAAQAGPDFMAVVGAVIGLGWLHETLDLDATCQADEVYAFGVACWDELHAAGYPAGSLILLAVKLMELMGEDVKIDQEASDRLGFSVVGPVNNNSSSLTSGSTISVDGLGASAN